MLYNALVTIRRPTLNLDHHTVVCIKQKTTQPTNVGITKTSSTLRVLGYSVSGGPGSKVAGPGAHVRQPHPSWVTIFRLTTHLTVYLGVSECHFLLLHDSIHGRPEHQVLPNMCGCSAHLCAETFSPPFLGSVPAPAAPP